MKTILFVVFIGNYGGVHVDKVRYVTEEQCAESSIEFNQVKISSGSVTAFCARNNDGWHK